MSQQDELKQEEQLAGKGLQGKAFRRLGTLLKGHWLKLASIMLIQAVAVFTIVARPWIIEYLIDEGFTHNEHTSWTVITEVTIWAAIGLAGLWAARFICLLIARLGAIGLVAKLLGQLRTNIYGHLQHLSISYFDRTRTGRIVARVDRDVDSLQPLFLDGIPQLLGITLRCGGGAIMLYLTLPNALFGLLILLPLLFVSMYFFKRFGTALWGRVNEATSRVTSHLVETINGVALIQQAGAQDRNYQQYSERLAELDRKAIGAAWGWGWFMPYVFILFTLGLCVVIITGGHALAAEHITPGQLTSCIFYVFLFLGPLMEVGDLFERASSGAAASQRIFLLLDTEPEITDPTRPRKLPETCQGEITFDHVYFSYRKDGEWILNNLHLTIDAGSTVAVVGPTGHGKSTLVQLITRFYDPQQGHIALDGIDIRAVNQRDLRKQVALVLQDNILFSGTVMANLQLANPTLSEQQIIDRSKDFGVDTVIERLPHGWYTEVGPRGDHVSHGQRQIICLLRAWLSDPAVLILDEATSAIDVGTEHIIQQAFKRLMVGRTAIVVAHRLATVRDADRIIVIENGQIAEDGNHNTLIQQHGIYAGLQSQLVRES